MKDPRLQGTHKNTVKAGQDCGGRVCDGSCGRCGADFIRPANIRRPGKTRPVKAKVK